MTCRVSTRSTGDALAYAIAVVTEVPMSLYLVQFEGEVFYVEAPDFTAVVKVWQAHGVASGAYDGAEQPESIALIHNEAVIRADIKAEDVIR